MKTLEADTPVSDQDLRTLIEHAPDVILRFDRELRYVYVNAAMEAVSGRPRSDFLGKTNRELGAPAELLEVWEQSLREVFRCGREQRFQFTVPCPGDPRHYDACLTPELSARGSVETVLVVTRDVTEQYQALEALRRSEAALRESEERFRLAARATREVIWDWDLLTNRITTNDGIDGVLGYPAVEVGRDSSWWAERCHPEDRERVLTGMRATLAGTGPDWSDEYRFRRADGSYVLVADRARVARDADGRAVRMIGALADVSRQRRAEEAARRAQKLESLTVLAGGVAHDFNNLLAVMLGRISLALGRLPEGSTVGVDLQKALDAGQRAAELAAKMLTFSGGRHFTFRRLDLNGLIQDARPDWEAVIPGHVRLTLTLDPSVPRIEADEVQLQQALTNLILNAVEAIGDREGTIHVATGVREVSADDTAPWRHTARPLSPGRYASVEVADDGCGLDRQTLARVFEPFFTTKFTGRGLGLPAVLGVARGHRGGIAVASEPGRGARLTLFLPVGGAAGASPASNRRPRPERAVLVIDDEALAARG